MLHIISEFDVVFLQEMVGETWDRMCAELPDFAHIQDASISKYFVTISLDKAKFSDRKGNYYPFEGSRMGKTGISTS